MSQPEASPAKRAGPSHVPELDGIRGLAILGVLAVHFIGVLDTQSTWEHVVNRAASYGVWGVDLFFVLSGFLITGILDDARGQPRYFGNFYARRSLRIFPLYYFVLTSIAVMNWLGASQYVPELSEISKVQAWFWTYTVNFYLPHTGDFSIPYISHFWSLAIEEQFYLAWPWLVGLLSRRQAMRAAVGLTALALVLRIVLPLSGLDRLYALLLTPCRLDALCVGAWLALAMRDAHWSVSVAGRAALVSKISGAVVALLSVWLILLEKADPVIHAVRGTALAVFFGTAIYLAASQDGPRLLKASLRVGWLRSLGKYSYGLYVYHGILGWHFHHIGVFAACSAALGSRWLGLLVSASFGVGLSLAIAVLSFHCFEAPFLGLKRFFSYGRDTSKSAVPAANNTGA